MIRTLLLAWIAAGPAAAGESPAVLTISDKAALETRITRELSRILDKFIGSGKSHITVFVDAEADPGAPAPKEEGPEASPKSKERAARKEARGSVQQLLWKDISRRTKVSVMPGFLQTQETSVAESVRKDSEKDSEASLEAARREEAARKEARENAVLLRIKRIVVSIVLDRCVADQELEKIKIMAAEILGLDPDRGDVLNVYRLSFVPAWKQALMANNILERMLPFLLWGGFLAGLLLVLFSLANRLLEKWMGLTPPGKKVEVVKGAAEGKGGARADAPVDENAQEGHPPRIRAEDPDGARPAEIPGFQKPFTYIDSGNVERLAMLLQELEYPTQSMAAVLGFLPVELRTALLTHLDPTAQAQALQHLCRMRKVAPAFLAQIDSQLREEVIHSYGGVMDTTEWLEAMSPRQCEAYLAFLDNAEPRKAREIRKRLIRFEDLLLLPEDQLPALVNSVPVTEWGPALAGVGGLADPVLAILPEESRNALRQRLEFEKPGPEAVLQVRAKVLSRAREMLRQGRLQLSRKAPAEAAGPACPPEGRNAAPPRPVAAVPGLRLGALAMPEASKVQSPH
jgi:hypothetical protein